jgi:hypothetical protein
MTFLRSGGGEYVRSGALAFVRVAFGAVINV